MNQDFQIAAPDQPLRLRACVISLCPSASGEAGRDMDDRCDQFCPPDEHQPGGTKLGQHVSNPPAIGPGGKFTVTNNISVPRAYYRLKQE